MDFDFSSILTSGLAHLANLGILIVAILLMIKHKQATFSVLFVVSFALSFLLSIVQPFLFNYTSEMGVSIEECISITSLIYLISSVLLLLGFVFLLKDKRAEQES